MNRFFYGFIAFLFLFLSIYPFSNVFADNDLVITGTPAPVPGDITDDQLTDILVSGITADLVSQGYEIDFSASDGDWDNFKNSVLDIIFDQASNGTGFIGEIYNSALYHNLIDEDFTIWYPDTSDDTILPGLSKRSIYRNLSDGLVNNILENRQNISPEPTPNPDSNYLDYINCINGSHQWGNLTPWSIFSNVYNLSSHGNLTKDISGVTLYSHPNSYQNFQYTYESGAYRSACAVGSNVASIYINSSVNGYWITDFQKPLDTQTFYYQWNSPPYTAFGTLNLDSGYGNASNGMSANTYTYKTANFQAYYNTLDEVFTFLVQTVRHVNIYVDGLPWSIVSGNETLPTVIINPGYVLQGTDYPLNYYFQEPPSFDYNRMIDIIKHALLQYGVIQWEDIADVFVDVNGQTAVAVLSIHRNDYDVLYDEQYPGIPLPNRFNTHLLDTSHQFLSPVIQTVEETTNILPGDIVSALAIGMFLTIFACLIHRLLE